MESRALGEIWAREARVHVDVELGGVGGPQEEGRALLSTALLMEVLNKAQLLSEGLHLLLTVQSLSNDLDPRRKEVLCEAHAHSQLGLIHGIGWEC